MGDSRSFRDAFNRRKTPAGKGLGGAPDRFRKQAADPGTDAFKQAGKSSQTAAHGDAFAPKAKRQKALPAPALSKAPKPGLTQPARAVAGKSARVKLGLPKPPSPAPARISKLTPAGAAQTSDKALGKPPAKTKVSRMTTGIAASVKAPRPAKPLPAKPQKLTPALPANRTDLKSTRLTTPAAPVAARETSLDPFGRKAAKPTRPQALVPAPAIRPASPMMRPAARADNPLMPRTKTAAKPAPKPAKSQAAMAEPKGPAPVAADVSPLVEEPKLETARAPLHVVQTESAMARIGLKKFRRAAQSSSLVLVTGAGAEVVTSVDNTDGPPEMDRQSATVASSGDNDSLVTDKPDKAAEPAAGPAAAAPASVAETPAAQAAPAAPPPEPPKPSPPPVEKPVEVVEATVEPPPSEPFNTASEPVDASGEIKRPKPGKPASAVETSWQPVEGSPVDDGQPAVAVLRKVETSPVGGFWGGAAANAKVATGRRGFNQDDMFGLMFGLAVIAFLFLWLFRGKGVVPPSEDELVTAQAAPSAASAPVTAAPMPLVDPFGNAPVDLRPSGPIVETSPQPPAAPPAVSATPPPAPSVATPSAATPPAISLASTRMHAWFCTASSRLTKTSRTQITGELAKFEDLFAGKELVVRGYADTRGSVEVNADLGERRAQTVATYLTKKGLSVVDVQGVGELEGLDDNQNCPNQRRVDIWVKGGPAETPSRACVPEDEAAALVCG